MFQDCVAEQSALPLGEALNQLKADQMKCCFTIKGDHLNIRSIAQNSIVFRDIYLQCEICDKSGIKKHAFSTGGI